MKAESLHWQIPPSRTRPGTITVHRDGKTYTARLWSGSDVIASSCKPSPSGAVDDLLELWREEQRLSA